jgi:predicted transcriptional regulator
MDYKTLILNNNLLKYIYFSLNTDNDIESLTLKDISKLTKIPYRSLKRNIKKFDIFISEIEDKDLSFFIADSFKNFLSQLFLKIINSGVCSAQYKAINTKQSLSKKGLYEGTIDKSVHITVKTVKESLSISSNTALKFIHRLESLGLVVRFKSNKGNGLHSRTRFILNNKFQKFSTNLKGIFLTTLKKLQSSKKFKLKETIRTQANLAHKGLEKWVNGFDNSVKYLIHNGKRIFESIYNKSTDTYKVISQDGVPQTITGHQIKSLNYKITIK